MDKDASCHPGMAKAEAQRKRGPTDGQNANSSLDKRYNSQIEARCGKATNPNLGGGPTGHRFDGPGLGGR